MTTKAEFLAQAEAAFEEWNDLLAKAGDRVHEPYEGTWSLRDVEAHIVSYHRFLVIGMGGKARPHPEMPVEVGNDWRLRNDFLHQADLQIPADEVFAEGRAVRAEFLAQVRARTQEQIDAPNLFSWHPWPLASWLREQIDHYADHGPKLRNWLASR